MAAKKISDLSAKTALTGTELFEVATAGVASEKVEARVLRGQSVTALASSAGVVTIDLSLGKYFTLALTENVTNILFTNLTGSGFADTIMLRITQDATARTVTWPASFRWEGSAPSVSTTSGAVDMLALTTFDNGMKWDGTLSKGRV